MKKNSFILLILLTSFYSGVYAQYEYPPLFSSKCDEEAYITNEFVVLKKGDTICGKIEPGFNLSTHLIKVTMNAHLKKKITVEEVTAFQMDPGERQRGGFFTKIGFTPHSTIQRQKTSRFARLEIQGKVNLYKYYDVIGSPVDFNYYTDPSSEARHHHPDQTPTYYWLEKEPGQFIPIRESEIQEFILAHFSECEDFSTNYPPKKLKNLFKPNGMGIIPRFEEKLFQLVRYYNTHCQGV